MWPRAAVPFALRVDAVSTCPNGHPVAAGERFCPHCGASTASTCAQGHSNLPTARFCHTCGIALTAANPVAPTPGAGTNAPTFAGADPMDTTVSVEPTARMDSGISLTPDRIPTADTPPRPPDPPSPIVGNPVGPSTVGAPAVSAAPMRGDQGPVQQTAAVDAMGVPPLRDQGERTKSRRSGVLVAVVVIVVVAAIAGGAVYVSSHHSKTGPRTASVGVAADWQSPLGIDPSISLASVSCPSASFCAAVDSDGRVVIYGAGGWSAPSSLSDGTPFTSVSCASSQFCVAVDDDGAVYAYDGTSWANDDNFTSSVTYASCPQAQFCMILDPYGDFVTDEGGEWNQSSFSLSGDDSIAGVSCSSSTSCIAVSSSGNSYTYDGQSWSYSQSVDSGESLTAVSCDPSDQCVAGSADGSAITYSNGEWSDPSPTGLDSGVVSISCPESGFCAAIDSSGDLTTLSNNSWSTPFQVVGTGDASSTSVSCASSNFCAVVDTAGDVITAPATSLATPVTTNTVPGNPAENLTSLLEQAGRDRPRVQNAVDVVFNAAAAGSGCPSSVYNARKTITNVIAHRKSLKQELARVDLSGLPRQALLRSELNSDWAISLRIDEQFLLWTNSEIRLGCTEPAANNANYALASRLDPQSTAMKTNFVNLWNPIAAEYGVRSDWTWDEI